MDFSSRWTDDPDESLRQASAAARKAVSLDDHNAYAYLVLGACETWLGRRDHATTDFRRSIELNPNDAESHAHIANHLVFAGRADEALEELKTAMTRLQAAEVAMKSTRGAPQILLDRFLSQTLAGA